MLGVQPVSVSAGRDRLALRLVGSTDEELVAISPVKSSNS